MSNFDRQNTWLSLQPITGVKFDDGTTQTTAASGAVTGIKSEAFTANGTWTAPSGVTKATFTVIGGGGGGSLLGYGGGAGGYCRITASVTAGTGYSVTIGAAGLGGNPVYISTPTAGGDSTVVVGATTYIARGGATGNSGGGGENGAGGAATNGDINLTGDAGVKFYDRQWGGRGWIGSYGEGGIGGTGGSGETASGRAGYSGIAIVEWLE